jgi:hypothetical protein
MGGSARLERVQATDTKCPATDGSGQRAGRRACILTARPARRVVQACGCGSHCPMQKNGRAVHGVRWAQPHSTQCNARSRVHEARSGTGAPSASAKVAAPMVGLMSRAGQRKRLPGRLRPHEVVCAGRGSRGQGADRTISGGSSPVAARTPPMARSAAPAIVGPIPCPLFAPSPHEPRRPSRPCAHGAPAPRALTRVEVALPIQSLELSEAGLPHHALRHLAGAGGGGAGGARSAAAGRGAGRRARGAGPSACAGAAGLAPRPLRQGESGQAPRRAGARRRASRWKPSVPRPRPPGSLRAEDMQQVTLKP